MSTSNIYIHIHIYTHQCSSVHVSIHECQHPHRLTYTTIFTCLRWLRCILSKPTITPTHLAWHPQLLKDARTCLHKYTQNHSHIHVYIHAYTYIYTSTPTPASATPHPQLHLIHMYMHMYRNTHSRAPSHGNDLWEGDCQGSPGHEGAA